jgi:predicted Fe-Mo cluster-binding NifX family protein
MKKAAIPSSANNDNASVDDRFGRCAYFCIYDNVTKEYHFEENNLKNAPEGVGPQVAEFLAKQEVDEVYTMEVGPKAEKILNQLNIKISIIESRLTIKQIIQLINKKN